MTKTTTKLLGAIVILAATLAISGIAIQDAMAASSANKTVYYSGSPEVIYEGTGPEILANVTLKTAKPTDVLILYNEECSLYTEVNLKSNKKNNGGTAGEILDEVSASHTIQLYVDNEKVGTPITMCSRTFGIETNILNQIQDLCIAVDNLNNATFGTSFECAETFLDIWIDTKSAHGWNWVVVNLGQNPDFSETSYHTIMVKGYYETEGSSEKAAAVTMARSLIVIKTHLDVAGT